MRPFVPTILALALLVACSSAFVDPYPQAKRVELFVATSQGAPEGSTLKAYRLSSEQQRLVRKSLRWERVGEVATDTACFVPHHFFRFYDGEAKMVGELAVCFCCDEMRTTPMVPERAHHDLVADYDLLRGVVRAVGARTDIDCGPYLP
jgi:hypothetical protein